MPGTSRDRPGTWALLAVLCLLLTSFAALAVTSSSGTSTIGSAPVGLGPAAITVGNSAAAACSDVDTCTTPAVAGVDAGDALVVVVTDHDGFGANPTSVEEVYTGGDVALTRLADSDCTGMEHGSVSVFGLANAAAQTSVTFTVDYAGDEYYTVHALDVHGAAPTPFEAAGTPVCSMAAGTEASASVTTTLANDLVILGVEVRAGEAITATGADALVSSEEITGADADSGAMLDESDADTGSITLSATFTSAEYVALAIGVKPSLPLTAGTVTPATASVDSGQTLGLTSTAATAGSGTYAYQWYTGSATCGAGTRITGATSLTYTTPALTAGTDYYCVEDTDSETGETAYTNVADVTVNAALTVHITPSAPAIDQGQSVSLTATAAGGTGTDSYRWYADASCTGTVAGTSTVLVTGDLTASATYCVSVTDSAYDPATVTATDSVTVSASGLGVTITPSAPSVDTGQSVNLTAEPSGGTSPYSYAWYAGTTCGTGSVLATTQLYTTAALTSDQSYCVSVTDSSYEPVSGNATVTVTVGSVPLSAVVLPVTPGIDSGQSIVLTASPSGGTAPYTYVWHEYDGSCSGSSLGTSQTLTTPALTATTEYCVVVTDSSAEPEVYTATEVVTVSPALSASITPASPDLDPGQSLTLTAEPSGGTGTDSFAWYLGSTCTGAVLGSVSTYETPALSTSSTYCVAVTDSAHSPVTVTATDTIPVSSAVLSVDVSPNSPTIDPSQDVVLTATPAGGTAPDSYDWYAGLSCTGSVVATAAAFTTPSLTSTTSYCVLVTDSSYEPVEASATATVTVSSAALSVSISPVNPAIDVGQSIALTAAPVGGTAPDSVAWYVGSSCSGTILATTLALTTGALSASTTYCVAVTDNSSEPATATATDTVTVSTSALSAAILPQSPSIDFGQSITLTADASGGTSPDSYAWFSGSACTGSILATTQTYATPDLSSSASYCVAVTDNSTDPSTVNATDAVTVSASPLSVAVAPQGPSIDNGQSITLTAAASGGTGSDSYAWYSGSACSGTEIGTGPTFRTPALETTTTYCVAVTDSAYSPATATATDLVTTSAAALTVAISPTTPSVTSGHSITLTATAAGGTGADSFAWYADATCTGSVVGTTASFTTPALTAAATYCVSATDSSSVPATVSASASVAVTAVVPPGSTPGKTPSTSFLSTDWWIIPVALVIVVVLALVVARRRRSVAAENPPDGGPTAGVPSGGGSPSAVVSELGDAPPPAYPSSSALGTTAAESDTAGAGTLAAAAVSAGTVLGAATVASGPEGSSEVPTTDAPTAPPESVPELLAASTPVLTTPRSEPAPAHAEFEQPEPGPADIGGPANASEEPANLTSATDAPDPAPIGAPPIDAAPAADQPAPAQVGAAISPLPGTENPGVEPADSALPSEGLSANPLPTDVPPERTTAEVDPSPGIPDPDVASAAGSPLPEAELAPSSPSVAPSDDLGPAGPERGSSLEPQPSTAPEAQPAVDSQVGIEHAPAGELDAGTLPVSETPEFPAAESATPVLLEEPVASLPNEMSGTLPASMADQPPNSTVESAEPMVGEGTAGRFEEPPPAPEPPVTESAPAEVAGRPLESPDLGSDSVPNWEAPVAPGTQESLAMPAVPDPVPTASAPDVVSEGPSPAADGSAASLPIALGPGPEPPPSPNEASEGLPPARRAVLAGWLFKSQVPDPETKE